MNSWNSLDAQVQSELTPAQDSELRALWENPVLHSQGSESLAPSAQAAVGLHSGRRSIELRGGVPPLPAGASCASLTLMDSRVEAAWNESRLWLDDLYTEVGQHSSRLLVGKGGASAAAWALALTEVQRAGGWLPLHAAVVARGEKAVAITGVSGAGKSTATLRLLGLGLRVICEDRAFWHAASGEVRGLDRWLRAFDDSVDTFAPQLRAQALAQRDIKGKLLVPLTPDAGAAQLIEILALGDGNVMNNAGRVKLLWETTGYPLTRPARDAAQHGVGRLLPLLRAQTVTRQTVLGAVQELLES
ncbi:hypothetical protein [Deinococcus sp.]|uniref:hypothetical protein n=1 Tax=Deinococcus sp. TaxID=47478 RepID=UPI0025BE0E9E|nr:hypothetical protein [Deinococcus sp.]